MATKRDVKIDAIVENAVVYTNDKGNEFVQLVISFGGKRFYICDFKQNDGLLLQVYKQERKEAINNTEAKK